MTVGSSSTSATVAGQTDSLKPEHVKYADALQTAAAAMEEIMALMAEPSFEMKTVGTWKADVATDKVAIHYRDTKNGRLLAGRTKLPLSPARMAYHLYVEMEKDNEWNDNIKQSRILHKLTDNVDIAHTITNDILIVKSREFLVARMLREVNGVFYLTGKSVTLPEVPETKSSVRGLAHVVGMCCRPVDSNSNLCIYDYVACIDFKGMMLRSILNPVLGRLTLKDVENVAKHAEELSKSSPSFK